jgi:hypothetical protein
VAEAPESAAPTAAAAEAAHEAVIIEVRVVPQRPGRSVKWLGTGGDVAKGKRCTCCSCCCCVCAPCHTMTY